MSKTDRLRSLSRRELLSAGAAGLTAGLASSSAEPARSQTAQMPVLEVARLADLAPRRAVGVAGVAVVVYAGALDRFRAGQTLAAQGLRTPAEQIEAAIIDSRARQVQAQLREQLANAKEKP
jgi:hypothetical protein